MKNSCIFLFMIFSAFVFAQKPDYNPNRDPIQQNDKELKINYGEKKTSICLCCNKDSKNKPLVMLNGKIISYEEFQLLDSAKIISVEVVKGEKAKELFNEDAPNGLLVIKAKRNWKNKKKKTEKEPILAI